MIDYSKLKPKKQKWLEVAIVLAVIIMFIGFLAYSGLKNGSDTIETVGTEEDKNNDLWYVKWIIAAVVIYFLVTQKSNTQLSLSDEVIIKFVADEIYKNKGIYLNTNHMNVRTQEGAPGQTYIEFLNECITFMHVDGTGIKERYPGESIKIVKKGKLNDEIEMESARELLALKKHMNRKELFDLTGEEA